MSKWRIGLFVALAVLPIVLALWLAGFDVAYQLGNYVVTDNAVVAGDVYQASAPAAGQVADLLLEVGDPVEKGQGVANLVTPSPAALALPFGRMITNVRSPAPGTVVHLNVVRGQAVTAGQSIAMVADLSSLYIVANVDETSFKDIRPGMGAEVKINALDRYFPGQVAGLVPDLGATPGQPRQTAANAPKVVPQVPVRVAFDYGDAVVYPGMTATVRIFVR